MPGGSTTVACVIGDPVRHSRSPAIHNAAFETTGLDWVYVAFQVPTGRAEGAVAAMRALGFGGMSVTMPHKEAVIATVDLLTPEAERLRAVNCIAWEPGAGDADGRLVGHNTDGFGFLASLRDRGFDPSGARCVVLGAGGAARSVVLALADAGAAEISVSGRSPQRVHQAVELAGGAGRALPAQAAPEVAAEADLLVNATPLGMSEDDPLPLPAGCLGKAFVADLVYHPARTELLEAAEAAGAPVVMNGIGMLVHQAARAFEIWTGLDAPLAAMVAAVA